MALGTPYIPDTAGFQQDENSTAGGEIISNKTAAQLAALNGATKTPTANFSLNYNGRMLSFTKGIPFITNAPLTAALNAAFASAPPIV